MDKLQSAINVFQSADDAWQEELEARFGKDAGQARYDRRGRGSFEDRLGELFLLRDKARMLAGF